MPRPTIKDIACELNLSPSTVSRALHDHPGLSLATKERVRKLADKLDYFPDSIARSLQHKSTNTIGVIVPEIKHDFFASAVSGIEEIAYEAGFTIIVSQSNEDYEREILNVNSMVSNRVAGLLVSISQTTINGEHFKKVQRRDLPIVFFNRICEDVDASCVIVDDYRGAQLVMKHLIDRGYKRIAHLAGPQNLLGCRKRFSAYLDSLNAVNIPANNEHIVYGGMHDDDRFIGMQKLIDTQNLPDAVFAVNDPVAVGALMCLKKNKIAVPDETALVGFSNNPIVSMLEPALTTVDEHPFELGKMAASILIRHIENREIKSLTEILKTRLIIREST